MIEGDKADDFQSLIIETRSSLETQPRCRLDFKGALSSESPDTIKKLSSTYQTLLFHLVTSYFEMTKLMRFRGINEHQISPYFESLFLRSPSPYEVAMISYDLNSLMFLTGAYEEFSSQISKQGLLDTAQSNGLGFFMYQLVDN